MAKPPKKVKILGKWYTIEMGEVRDLHDNMGCCQPQVCRITILKDQSPEQMRDTVWHELKHAIWYEMGLRDISKVVAEHQVDDLEETIVNSLSTGEIAVLRANPTLVKYLIYEE